MAEEFMMQEMERFDPYLFLNRVAGVPDSGEPILLSDEFRASDLGVMLKTALRSIEILSLRVAQLEQCQPKKS